MVFVLLEISVVNESKSRRWPSHIH
jgi:hypothetical protein